jgi:KUP system potassium uptake protein
MVVTAVLALVVVRRHWRWPLPAAMALILPFVVIDLVFLGANLAKVVEGGYVPLLIGMLMVLVMRTWGKGRDLLAIRDRENQMQLMELIETLGRNPPPTIPGTAVYLTAWPDQAPVALLHNLKHFKSLHERNVILTVSTADLPRVARSERMTITAINDKFLQLTLRFGYMEEPNVPLALEDCRTQEWSFDVMTTSFILSRRSLKLAADSSMPPWQSRLFIFLSRNAASPTDYFSIPAGRVVEIGAHMNV